ncbi:MAG TPA: FadR/GntR family transcriptional regulator [Acidobacteriota bacterium]|nr:FadR/GntR family transcriptional regulator [Acidobacteriota bacterium]
MFTAISREATLTQRALDQLQTLIINKSLKPGEKLPAERTLGEMLGVSRTVVREVVRLLTAKGLVEVRAGSGTYVCELGAEIVTNPIDLLLSANVFQIEDIHETRTALEIGIVELAAERARASDIREMERNLREMKRLYGGGKARLDISRFASKDMEFHTLLARATRNPLLEVLVESLNGVMRQVRFQLLNTIAQAPQRVLFYHSRIVKKLKERDAEGARVVMESHLEDTIMMLRLSTQRGDSVSVKTNLPDPRLLA